ncbi:MAG: FAD-dependent oxidoreductase, partial [Clostridia bacterium]
MKKYLILILALVLLAVPALAEPATGVAQGFGGEVSVTLTVENGVLTGVEAIGASETSGVGSTAIETMPGAMLAAGSVVVDGVAGATITSNAVLEAAAKAAETLGIDLSKAAQAHEAVEVASETCDVLVIGGGGAGLAAASAAAEEGANVILLEKLGFTGGSTAMSGGVMCRSAMAGDPKGTMPADDLYAHFMTLASNKADPAVVRTYVDNSAADNVWAFSMGEGVKDPVRYHLVPENIMALKPQGSGAELMKGMDQGARERGVDIRLNTAATELIYEDGRVTGAVVTLPNGDIQKLYGKGGVVLCTGGFPNSPELLAQYGAPNAETVLVRASAGATGDGLVMARDLGAMIQFGNDWDTDGYHTLAASGYPNYLSMVLLNAKGERFIREDDQLPFVYTEMVKQVGQGNLGFYFLTDISIDPEIDALVEKGDAVKLDTIKAVAEYMGCDEQTLTATLTAYNAAKGQIDPATGKAQAFMLGIEAPYYVASATPVRVVTIGGLVINKDAEVLNEQAQAIPGLYAAGEVANASFYYNIYA